MKIFILTLSAVVFFLGCSNNSEGYTNKQVITGLGGDDSLKIHKSKSEWKRILSEDEYYVTREKGTERAFSGKYVEHKESGVYTCVCCTNELFLSRTKFDSGTGWPSFYKPISAKSVNEPIDLTGGMRRVEVVCSQCDAHLGHVFNDGPKPTYKRYCINSVALIFINEN